MESKLNLIGLGSISSNIVKNMYNEKDCEMTIFKENLSKTFYNLEDNEIEWIKNPTYLPKEHDISETFCFVDGHQGISGIVLSVLERYKNKPITIFYIKKYVKNNTEVLNQKITFNVLQEYARSGMFSGIFIIDYDYICNDIILNLPDDQDIEYNDVEKLFIDKVISCVYVYWRLLNENYLEGNKINFDDTIYRIKTFFVMKNNIETYLYELSYPESFIYVIGVKNKMTKKELVELQNFKEKIRIKDQNCILLSSDDNFVIGIAESKIVQESNYI